MKVQGKVWFQALVVVIRIIINNSIIIMTVIRGSLKIFLNMKNLYILDSASVEVGVALIYIIEEREIKQILLHLRYDDKKYKHSRVIWISK